MYTNSIVLSEITILMHTKLENSLMNRTEKRGRIMPNVYCIMYNLVLPRNYHSSELPTFGITTH